jgi:hypothetical protein
MLTMPESSFTHRRREPFDQDHNARGDLVCYARGSINVSEIDFAIQQPIVFETRGAALQGDDSTPFVKQARGDRFTNTRTRARDYRYRLHDMLQLSLICLIISTCIRCHAGPKCAPPPTRPQHDCVDVSSR